MQPVRKYQRTSLPHASGIDFTDVEILRALGHGLMSLRDIGEHLGCGVGAGGGGGGDVSPQFVAFRLRGLVKRRWVVVSRMPGKGNGARRVRALTRGGRMALKRFGGFGADQTKGVKACRRNRTECNKLTDAEREKLLRQAMIVIYSGKGKS